MHALRYLIAAVLLLSTGTASAEGSRVGFVDMARIDEEAPQIDTVRSQLQAEFAERERSLLERQKALRELEERLVNEGMRMSDDERAVLEREVQRGQRNWKRKQDEFREDYIIRKNEEMEDLTKNITNTIRDFARAEKYDVILLSGVVYASDKADVTGGVLEWLARKQQEIEHAKPRNQH